MTTPPSKQSLLQTYRALLRATNALSPRSHPARLTLLTRLRTSFRSPTRPFNPTAINRTLLLLRSAAARPGLERKVVKNLARVWREKDNLLVWRLRGKVLKDNAEFQGGAWGSFEEGVKGLEGGMGVDLGEG